MATKVKSKKVTDDMIVSMYMDYVLEHEVVPKSVYKFCNAKGFDEVVFYENFGSMAGLQKSIWTKFFLHTQALVTKSKEYNSFSNKDKLLTFYYSFFELLALNRSYVLFTLENDKSLLKKMEQLKDLRKHVKTFVSELIVAGNADKALKVSKHNPKLFSEGAWLQLLFILKFWMDDDSACFEKTDIVIEKSVNTVFDVFDNTPLDNIIDFGKFLFKEKMA